MSPLAISPEGDWVSSHPVADAEISVAAGEPITQSLEVKGQCAFELVKRRKNLLENEALQKYKDDQRAIELEFSQATKQAREDLSQAKKSALGGYDSATRMTNRIFSEASLLISAKQSQNKELIREEYRHVIDVVRDWYKRIEEMATKKVIRLCHRVCYLKDRLSLGGRHLSTLPIRLGRDTSSWNFELEENANGLYS